MSKCRSLARTYGYPQTSEIAYSLRGYAIIPSSSKERSVKCKMTENDRRGRRGRGDRLASASGKLLLKA